MVSVPQATGSHGLLLSSEATLPKWDKSSGESSGWSWGRRSKGPTVGVAGRAWPGVGPRTLSFPQSHGFHPCWPRGYSTHVLLQDVYESPCTAAQRPQTFNSSARVRVSGRSDPALCRGLVSELFNVSSCRFSRCSFNGVFQPPVTGSFIVSRGGGGPGAGGLGPEVPGSGRNDCTPSPQAFSAFFYTVEFLRTGMGLPVATLQQLEAAAVTVCNQSWSEVGPARGARPASVMPPVPSFALSGEGSPGLLRRPLQGTCC